jgi:hypothetical protein
MQPALYCFGRNLETVRDLCVGHMLEVIHPRRYAFGFGELGDGALQTLRSLPCLYQPEWIQVAGRHVARFFQWKVAATLLSDLTMTLGPHNSTQPARERHGIPQLMQFDKGFEKGALGGVFSLVRIAKRPIGVIHHHGFESANQLGESLISNVFLCSG